MKWKATLSEAKFLGARKSWRYLNRILKQKLFDYPREMTVEASSRCNLNCVFCVTRDIKVREHRKQDFLSLRDFKQLVNEISQVCPRINFSLFGEPLLNPELDKMIAYAEGNGIITTLFTNATLLTPENIEKLLDSGLTKVITSLESFRRDVYEATKCGAELEQTQENIKRMIEEKKKRNLKTPQIVLRLVITQKNVNDIESYVDRAQEMGADAVSLKPLAIWPQGTQEYKQKMLNDFVLDHAVSRHKKDQEGKFIFKQRTTPCFSLNTPAILSDGRVCLCWYDALGETVIGNIHEESFKNIWNKARSFRKNKMSRGNFFSICLECVGIGAEDHRLIHL